MIVPARSFIFVLCKSPSSAKEVNELKTFSTTNSSESVRACIMRGMMYSSRLLAPTNVPTPTIFSKNELYSFFRF
jgi:hypothetical protein